MPGLAQLVRMSHGEGWREYPPSAGKHRLERSRLNLLTDVQPRKNLECSRLNFIFWALFFLLLLTGL